MIKKKYNSNGRQNTLPNNLYGDKYCLCEHCTFFVKSELKCEPNENTVGLPRWKINSFLSEISVCWRCTEKIIIQIERAFSVILRASPATRRSFQPSPQHPTVAAENLRFNTPLATANARWCLPSHTIVDCIDDSSSVSTVC